MSSGHGTCNPDPTAADSPAAGRSGCAPPNTRTKGIRHMFAALDLASGQIFYRFRDRKRWQEFLDFCKQLRRFPAGSSTWSVTTTDHTAKPRSGTGTRPTVSSWSARPPTRPG
jgi:hypothetical protein